MLLGLKVLWKHHEQCRGWFKVFGMFWLFCERWHVFFCFIFIVFLLIKEVFDIIN